MGFELIATAPAGTEKNFSYTIKDEKGQVVNQFESPKNLVAASVDGKLQFADEAEISTGVKGNPATAIAYRGKQMVNRGKQMVN